MFRSLARFCTKLVRLDAAPIDTRFTDPLADCLSSNGSRLKFATLHSVSCSVLSIEKTLVNCPNARFDVVVRLSRIEPRGVRALGDRIRRLTIGFGDLTPEDKFQATRDCVHIEAISLKTYRDGAFLAAAVKTMRLEEKPFPSLPLNWI